MGEKSTYWISLGEGITKPHYAQSITDDPHWRDSAMRDRCTCVLIEVEFDTETSEVKTKVLKNSKRKRVFV